MSCASSFHIFSDDKALETAIEKISSFTRAEEGVGMVTDPFAEVLLAADDVSRETSSPSTSDRNSVNLSTQYLDDCILRALESKPFIKQVVLFSSNLETRPYRLVIPSGTILFDVSPESVHDYKRAHLKDERVPRGCLHVPISVPHNTKLEEVELLMSRRGFQGSKPSIWALQDIDQYCRDEQDFEEVVVYLSKWMARDSLVMGSIARKKATVVKEILAACLLQGDCFSLEAAAKVLYSSEEGGEALNVNEVSLFYAVQTGRSAAERDVYEKWTKLQEEEGDEDYSEFNFQ